MTQRYKVAADNLVGFEQGDTLTVDDLPEGTNAAALVAAGTLVAVKPKPPKKAASSAVDDEPPEDS